MIDEILLFHHSHLDVGYTHSQPILWELQQEYLTQVVTWLEDTAGDFAAVAAPKWACGGTQPALRRSHRAPQGPIARVFALGPNGAIGMAAARLHPTARRDADNPR